MIGNMTCKAGMVLNVVDTSMYGMGPAPDYDDYEKAQELYEDAVTTDAALSNIRTILCTAKVMLEDTDRKNVEARNGVLEVTLSSIYNILLTPEGKPK